MFDAQMSIRRLLVLALSALAALPAAAHAAPVEIDGSPLNVAMDELGRLQARFDNAPNGSGEFFPPSSPVANAGFHVSVYDADGSATLYGPAGGGGEPVDANEDGQPDGPVLVPPGADGVHRLSTSWFAGPSNELQVTVSIAYRDGNRHFDVNHSVVNASGAPVRFTAAEYADLFLGGSDSGFGFLEAGPPRIVGGVNQTGIGGGIVEGAPPWSAYEAGSLGTVNSHLANGTGPAFDNTISTELSDNAAGVQWDDNKSSGLGSGGARAVYDISWRFDEFEVPLPPPVAFQNVNIDPEGVVRVKPPPGQTIAGAGGENARAAQSGFVQITRPVQIPVGSIVDTRKGSVGMTSAANVQGGLQNGDFEDGRFKVLQRPAARPVTELRMSGGNFSSCRRNVGNRAVAAARRIRRLSGNARGRFRTRGRNSSATVRGTTWTMSDQCNGTLTRVRSGSVRVRDFAKNRTITLRRGKRYLARPKRR